VVNWQNDSASVLERLTPIVYNDNQLQELLSAYKQAAGSIDTITRELERNCLEGSNLLCLQFRRMCFADANWRHRGYSDADDDYGFNGAWYVQLWLAEILCKTGDERALPFVAEGLVGRPHALSNDNGWGLESLDAYRIFVSLSVC